MEKHQNLTTIQYVGLVRNLNSRMAQMPPLFNNNQQLDESELVDCIANKLPIIQKAMMISQVFNPETGGLETSVEHCERADTTNNISMANFLPQMSTATPLKTKSVPRRLRNVRKAVRNVARTPHFIVASMDKTIVTPQGSENSSR